MDSSKINTWLRKSLIEKMASFRHRYWAAKSKFYFGPQFAAMGIGSVIYKPILISNPECIEIGERVFIRDGIRLEVIRDPYGRTPILTIGSNSNIEQHVHIVCHSRITIGSNVSITGTCAIVDVTHPFRDVTSPTKIGSRISDEDSFVEIGDGAFIGYGAVVLPNVRIGRHSVIGANSVVVRDVPDYSVAAGAPATVLQTFDRQANVWRKLS